MALLERQLRESPREGLGGIAQRVGQRGQRAHLPGRFVTLRKRERSVLQRDALERNLHRGICFYALQGNGGGRSVYLHLPVGIDGRQVPQPYARYRHRQGESEDGCVFGRGAFASMHCDVPSGEEYILYVELALTPPIVDAVCP